MLWAWGDSAPDIPSEGVVLDVRARSEAVQEEREKDRRCAFRREWSTRGLLGPPVLRPKDPSVPTQPVGLWARMGAVGKQLGETLFLIHLLQLQNVSQAELNIKDSFKTTQLSTEKFSTSFLF